MSTWRVLRPGEPPEFRRGTLAELKALVEAEADVLGVRTAGWREFRLDDRLYHIFTVRDSRGRFVYTVNLVREQS